MKAIRNCILTAALLTSSHYLFVYFNKDMSFGSQNFTQGNRIRAQDFLYGNEGKGKPVILGSSLIGGLSKDSLSGFINLGFSAQTIFDGFACVQKKGDLPHYLFVESNLYLNKEDLDFTHPLLATAPFLIKKNICSLRDRYQPSLMLGSTVVVPLVTSLVGLVNNSDGKKEGQFENKPEFFQKMLSEHLRKESVLPDEKKLHNALDLLHKWTDVLKKNNVRVVFFEMPVNEKLRNSPGVKRMKEALKSAFPPGEYLYIPDADGLDLKTVDGKHLDKVSADIYSGYFRIEAEKIMSGKK
jgi:hypothetical protein